MILDRKEHKTNTESLIHPSTMSSDKYNVSFTSGGQLRSHLNRLSLDGHYSIAFFNNHITVYSLQTRLPIKSFTCVENLQISSIIDTFVSPINNNLIYLLSDLNGSYELHILNWYENLKNPLISTIKLNSLFEKNDLGVEFLKIINLKSNDETILNLLVKQNKAYSILSYNLNDNLILNIFKTFNNIADFCISSNSKNLAFVSNKIPTSSNLIFSVFSFDDNNEFELASYDFDYSSASNSKSKIVKIAISNNQADPLLAIGTSNGPIALLFDLSSGKPTQRLLKWHIDPIRSLDFNPDSTYLLSGGSEKVLVFWNIMNEKQQFLPRLNGLIDDIQIDHANPNLIGLSLNVIDNDLQYLILGTTDLLSKLDINVPHLFSGLNSQNTIKKNYLKDVNSFVKLQQNSRFKHNYNLSFKIHPKNNYLYLPSGRHIQIFDYLHNNQVDNLAIAPAVQQYGKVGNENKINDPLVVGLEFINSSKTKEKEWLITCDVEIRGEADDLKSGSIERWETLRFWKYSGGGSNGKNQDNVSMSDSWNLQTKILRPHDNFQITAILPAPESYFGGEAVVTTDSCGNIRLWRPNSQGIWSLRKFYSSGSELSNANLNLNSNSKKIDTLSNIANNEGTTCSWSPDGSMIAVGRDGKVILLDVNTFEPIHTIKPSISNSRFHSHASIDENNSNAKSTDVADNKESKENGFTQNPNNKIRYIDLNLQDKHILSVNFTSNGKLLAVETRSHLVVVDILKNTIIFGLLFSDDKSNSGFGGSLVKLVPRKRSDILDGSSCDLDDTTSDELLVVGKFFNSSDNRVHSKVSLWNISDRKSSISCKWSHIYDGDIIGAEWCESWQKWIMADSASNLGDIGYGKSFSRNSMLNQLSTKQDNNWIVASLLDNARIMNHATNSSSNGSPSQFNSNTEEFSDRVGLQSSVFDNILDHIDGISVETLFERVLRVV